MKKNTLKEEINRIGKLMNLTEAAIPSGAEKEVIEAIMKFFGVDFTKSITLASGKVIEGDAVKTIFKTIEEHGLYNTLSTEEKEIMRELTSEVIAKEPSILQQMTSGFEQKFKNLNQAHKEQYIGTYLSRMRQVLGAKEYKMLENELDAHLPHVNNPGHSSTYNPKNDPTSQTNKPSNTGNVTSTSSTSQQPWQLPNGDSFETAVQVTDKRGQNEILELLRNDPVKGVEFQLWESQVDTWCKMKNINDQNWIYMIKLAKNNFPTDVLAMQKKLYQLAKNENLLPGNKVWKFIRRLSNPEVGETAKDLGQNVKNVGSGAISATKGVVIASVSIFALLLLYKFAHISEKAVDEKVSKVIGVEPGVNPISGIDSVLKDKTPIDTAKPKTTQQMTIKDF
jgi:hypothetical protein